MWGTGVSHKEFGSWMLQGIPTVGHTLADRIMDSIGFPLQLKPGIGVEQFKAIDGIGDKKAEMIVNIMREESEGENNG